VPLATSTIYENLQVNTISDRIEPDKGRKLDRNGATADFTLPKNFSKKCTEKLENQVLPLERREELEKELNTANNALRGWGKIDAEQQRKDDIAKTFSDARRAHDRAAELGAL
jgi:hypothetical protein